MLNRFYKAQGQDQLDLFERPDPHWLWRKLPLIVLGIVIGMLFASVAFAQEGKAIILTKALICDTEDQAKAQIDAFTSADHYGQPATFVEGCGYLQHPVPAIVTPIGEYENKYVVALMATIQIPDLPIQYGYIAFRPKEKEEGV